MDNCRHVDVTYGHPEYVWEVLGPGLLVHTDSQDSGFTEQHATTQNSLVSSDHTLGQSTDSGGHMFSTSMDVASSRSSEDLAMVPERLSTTSGDMVDDQRVSSPSTDADKMIMPTIGMDEFNDSVISEAETTCSRSGIDICTIYTQRTVEEVSSGNTDIIVVEEVVEVSCGPKPVPRGLVYVDTHRPSVMVKIKWPMSYGRFLRVIEDTDTPKIIIDIYRKEFEHQYNFIQEIKSAVDDDTNSYYFMCFRYDLFGLSFYLTPDCTAECLSNEIKLVFTEATRSEVIQDRITTENSKYWYIYETFDFNVLRSVYAPKYYLSIEKGRHVTLRNNHGNPPFSRNFNIKIFQKLAQSTPPMKTSGIRNMFCCFGWR